MNSTTLRILNDITGTDKTIEVERDNGELVISLMHVVGIIRRQEKFIRLAVHFRHDVITMHWWADDIPLAKGLMDMCSIPHRTLEMLQKARVGQ
jgi:hypothetical protein